MANNLPRRAAVLGGNRIPFARQFAAYAEASNQDMFTAALDGLVARYNLGGKHLWANSEMRRLLHASWETSRTELSQSEAVTLVRALLNRNRA